MQPNDVLVQPTEKVSCKRATSGKNESRALLLVTVKDDTVILQLHHKKRFSLSRMFSDSLDAHPAEN